MSFAAVLLLSGTVALRFRKLSKLAFKKYFSILEKCIIYLRKRKQTRERAAAGRGVRGTKTMSMERHYKSALEEENQRLREENDRLMDIVVQMKGTLNRLVKAYITESK